MKRIVTCVILVLLCLLYPELTRAQSWDWGKRMGSPYNAPQSAYSKFDGILDMSSDALGNIYTVTRVGSANLDADGHSLTGHGATDILVTSFRCDGSYRWSKLIGTNSDSDFSISVKADRLGGIYVCGSMPLWARPGFTGGHIDSDTTIGSTTKTMFITKFDTSGNYQWLRMPQPDTISYRNAMVVSLAVDMDVDEQGNIFMLCYLTPGAYAQGAYIVPSTGLHILKYTRNGQFAGGINLPYSVAFNYQTELLWSRMTYDATMNRFILTGRGAYGPSGTITIGGTPLAPAAGYVATFNSSGVLGILKTGPSVVIEDRAKTDAQGNIYVAGTAGDSAVFNGVTFLNPGQSKAMPLPFAMKLDAITGNTVWTQKARTSGSAIGSSGSCLALSNGKVLMAGFFSGKVVFPTDSFSNVYVVDSEDAYIAQLDATTGAVQRKSTLGGPSKEFITKITQDNRGNFYVGGSFTDRITPGGSTLQSVGGHNDVFVAKWGKPNCNCTLPAPGFTSSLVSGKTMRYTYTGTTSGIDSLVWNWGEVGRTKKLLPAI